ncbi:Fic family protein [Candidatus Kaiserbacteria bacterium]|nr:Fic family protein [Candidatus Kaiserbacteria bacterium]
MHEINSRQIKILEIIKAQKQTSFGFIFGELENDYSERTIKRDLTELAKEGYLSTAGGGRSLEYEITFSGRLFLPVDVDLYSRTDLDSRVGVCEKYELMIWEDWPQNLFSAKELDLFAKATARYKERSEGQSADTYKRELERFVIEMSWKSSQIEGNTYTLLDTELLLKEGIVSPSNTEDETQMILNHKAAFDFVLANQAVFKSGITVALIDEVHKLLMKDLLDDFGIRKSLVGITGSRYQPLDNQHQLKEALDNFVSAVGGIDDVFSQALTCLVGISYIQPFVDGNKRTARLMANGILLASGLAPLSYRDVDERAYRAKLLVFYEQLSLVSMKELLISQYNFSAEHYTGLNKGK